MSPISCRILLRVFLATCLLVSQASAQLIISEFLASNSNSITDENGDSEDWIEIRNTGASSTNTLGWYLTDDAGLPRKWAFPSRTIAAGGHLLVFASNKNRKPASGNLHTNFRLSDEPDYLALTHDLPGGGIEVV